MVFNAHLSLLLPDKSYSSILKKEIKKIAEETGFSGSRLGEVEIVVSELLSNLVKHAAPGGELLVKTIVNDTFGKGIEIICIDNGPGMAETHKMVLDGVSTTQTLGHGLGAIKRLADEFDIYSQPGWGSIVLCRAYIARPQNTYVKKQAFRVGAVMVPKTGEIACGDGWAYANRYNDHWLLAVDGLGHGEEASKAAQEAVKFFINSREKTPQELLVASHDRLRKTRGVVGASVVYNSRENKITYCGIGNIGTRYISSTSVKTFISYNGIIGLNKPNTMHNQMLENVGAGLIILTSDGIRTRWDLAKHSSIARHDNSIIAAAIYKDFARRTDDALVIVAKIQSR